MAMSNSIMPEFYTLPFLKCRLWATILFLSMRKNFCSLRRVHYCLNGLPLLAPLTRRLCNRRLSIGGDGLILAMVLDSEETRQMAVSLYGDYAKDCDLSWTYYNNDGSQAHMCGNGLRCLALWAKLEKNMSGELKVATQNGAVTINLLDDDNITVILGAPKLNSKEIPFVALDLNEKQIVRYPFTINGLQFPITCVNVGNPHCLIFEGSFLNPELFKAFGKDLPVTADSAENGQDFFPKELVSLASSIERDKHFPERTNVHFVRVLDRRHIQVFIWERGCGSNTRFWECFNGCAHCWCVGGTSR